MNPILNQWIVRKIMNIEKYISTKDVFERNQILKTAVLKLPENGKEFFLAAFKKERYLDMKLTAVRGYAEYASEDEVNVLMKKMFELLIRRGQTTPNNYQEYEPMRSPFLIPFLLNKYKYQCFSSFAEQLEKQYDMMDDTWKGIFTLNENGTPVKLRKISN